MQTEKRHPIAHALHIIGTGRTTLNNYIGGPGAILSALFGAADECLEDHIGSNRAPICENQRFMRRYLTDEAAVVLLVGFRLIRYGLKAEEAFRPGMKKRANRWWPRSIPFGRVWTVARPDQSARLGKPALASCGQGRRARTALV